MIGTADSNRALIPPMRLTALCVIACLFPAARLSAQSTLSSGGFVTTLGRDTIAIERFSRTADRIEGDVAIRNPRTRTIHFVARLGANGTITRFEMTSQMGVAAPNAPLVLERYTTIEDTVLTTDVRRGGVRDTTASGRATVPRSGAVPFVQSATVFGEQMVQQLLRAGVDSLGVPQFTFGPNHAFPSYVRRIGRDSVELNVFGPVYARIDASGRLLGASGRATTIKTETARVTALDYDAVLAGWIAAERKGLIAGAVSARDTVEATVGAAALWIDYGQPMKRGRTIFGVVVPWDSVWRTGANAATQFRTSVDITIGGKPVPAGTYTLWTIPTRAGATLIVNRQTGQWGTQYDPSQDLVRIPLTIERVAVPVEQFTFAIVPAASGAMLTFTWDDRRFRVPVSAGR